MRTVIGKNVWLFIKNGSITIPIKCLTSHTITGSQEISSTDTKCGRSKAPQGDPDFQITGEGQIMLLLDAEEATNVSSVYMYNLLSSGTKFTVVSGPANESPLEGDVTYTGVGYLSEWEETYPAGEESTFSFTIELETLGAVIEPAFT